MGTSGLTGGRDGDGEGQFQTVQNRKRRLVNHGSSQVELGDDALAAPVEFYVGNTTPATTEMTK